MKIVVITVAVAAALGVGYWMMTGTDLDGPGDVAAGEALVEITVPEDLSEQAVLGKKAYDTVCAACHGVDAVGQNGIAPPLIHKIYEPGHHGDESFQRAVAHGVQAHHWPFGDMPPVEGLTRGDVTMIVRYIREVQQANGIH